MTVRAIALNCTLTASPEGSSTELLAQQVLDALAEHGVEGSMVRVVDHDVRPGVSLDEGDGDEWPSIRARIMDSDILVFATPTWLAAAPNAWWTPSRADYPFDSPRSGRPPAEHDTGVNPI